MTTMSRSPRPIGVRATAPLTTGLPRSAGAGTSQPSLATDNAALARRPWTVRAGGSVLMVRGARPADLAGVAALHHRCTPTTLLNRYRSGGNTPSVSALQHMLGRATTVVVTSTEGRVIAWGAADPELTRPRAGRPSTLPVTRAEIGVLVEDGWQGLGIGRALVRHLAAAAALAGMRELVSPTSTQAAVAQRLLGEIGTTKRIEVDGEPVLRVLLPESAALGLGALQRLGHARPGLPARTG
ncbi:N-acetyltransferase family protein [Jatrophihabitans sp. YIM 134969]